MADEAKIAITGDNDPLKKSLAESERLIESFASRQRTYSNPNFDPNIQTYGGKKLPLSYFFGGPGSPYGAGGAGPGSPFAAGAGGAGGGAGGTGAGGAGGGGLPSMPSAGAIGISVAGWNKVADAIEKTVTKVFEFGVESARVFSETEQASVRLDAAMRATGNSIGFTRGELNQMNSDLERTAHISEAQGLNAMRQFTTMENIRGDIFRRATEDIGDLSALLGQDATQSARMLADALQDPERGLMRLSLAGVRFTQVEQDRIKALQESMQLQKAQAAILDVVEGKSRGAAATRQGTFDYRVEKFNLSVEKLQKSLGPGFAEFIGTLAETGSQFLEACLPLAKALSDVMAKGFPPVIFTIWEWGKGIYGFGNAAGNYNPFVDDKKIYRADLKPSEQFPLGQTKSVEQQQREDASDWMKPKGVWGTVTEQPEWMKKHSPLYNWWYGREAWKGSSENLTSEQLLKLGEPVVQRPLNEQQRRGIGTFENIEDMWKRISTSGAQRPLGEVIDDAALAAEKRDERKIVIAESTNTKLDAANVYLQEIRDKPGGTLKNG